MSKEKSKMKEYSNGEVTIVWKPGLCIHSANCVKGLPQVFDPKARPWINVEGAGTEALINQVKQCPSGALSYYLNAEKGSGQETAAVTSRVEVMPNGPLMVHGELLVKDAAGNETTRSRVTAFCRCGASENKPYCDGSHRKVGFDG